MGKVDTISNNIEEKFEAYISQLKALKHLSEDQVEHRKQLIRSLEDIKQQVLETRHSYYEFNIAEFNDRFAKLIQQLDKMINHICDKAKESSQYIKQNEENLDATFYANTYLRPILDFKEFIDQKSARFKANNKDMVEFGGLYSVLQITLPGGFISGLVGFMIGGPIGLLVGAAIGVGVGLVVSGGLSYGLHRFADRPSVTNTKMHSLIANANAFFGQPSKPLENSESARLGLTNKR